MRGPEQRRLVLVGLLACWVCACAPRVEWGVRFDAVEERPQTALDVRYQTGCGDDGRVLARELVEPGAPPTATRFDERALAVHVVAIDGACRAYARGCVELSGSSRTGAVQLSPMDEDLCASGACPLAGRCAQDAGVDGEVDGGVGDGGAPLEDASSDGPATDAGPPLTECRTGGVLEESAFCDGFEDPGLTAWSWQVGFGRAEAVVGEADGVTPFRGVRMLRATTTRANTWAQLVTCPFRPGGACPSEPTEVTPDQRVEDGDYHMRVYLYVPSAVAIGHISVMHAGTHRGVAPVEPPAGFNLDGPDAMMYVDAARSRFPRAGEEREPFPRDRWVCVQSQLHVADEGGAARTWLDGELVVEVTDIDTYPGVPYVRFGLGVAWSDEQEPISLYFDEVAVARAPIPCE
ncbi:MAG: hypothetical protein KF901_33490 [Myxococcales bacterium]|nr:hypothetical protein [Myxococcales bacterium]